MIFFSLSDGSIYRYFLELRTRWRWSLTFHREKASVSTPQGVVIPHSLSLMNELEINGLESLLFPAINLYWYLPHNTLSKTLQLRLFSVSFLHNSPKHCIIVVAFNKIISLYCVCPHNCVFLLHSLGFIPETILPELLTMPSFYYWFILYYTL